MPKPIEIIEIGDRPPTGVSSRPFFCLGNDGNSYYVKLGTALPDEKIMEWIFGFLATKVGLPTPVGQLVTVTAELSKNSVLDTSEFGYGIGYGSREFANARDLEASDIKSIDPRIRAEILIFDWWIYNEDRKLGKLGGNPNILINDSKEISLIDHGNALDIDFDSDGFFEDHAFAADKKFWSETENRKAWEIAAKSAIKLEADRRQSVPDEWWQSCASLKPMHMTEPLERVFADPDSFWKPFN